jgi:lycopene cyclase domain-containing protein
VPVYLISILVLMFLPAAGLYTRLRRELSTRVFFGSVGLVALLGWTWSYILNLNGWWTFAPHALTGLQLGSHLPVEEMLFYPSGGAICILLYETFRRRPGAERWPSSLWRWYAWGGTAFFIIVAWARRAIGPWYLCSQILLYDLGLVLPLSGLLARSVDLRALLQATLVMTCIGYGWDHIGFAGDWWAYHASTDLWIGRVPFDDFNFFAFAPAAAVSIYLVLVRSFERAGLPASEASGEPAGMPRGAASGKMADAVLPEAAVSDRSARWASSASHGSS